MPLKRSPQQYLWALLIAGIGWFSRRFNLYNLPIVANGASERVWLCPSVHSFGRLASGCQ